LSRGIAISIKTTSGCRRFVIFDCLSPIFRLANDVYVIFRFQQGAKTLSQDLVIVRKQHGDLTPC